MGKAEKVFCFCCVYAVWYENVISLHFFEFRRSRSNSDLAIGHLAGIFLSIFSQKQHGLMALFTGKRNVKKVLIILISQGSGERSVPSGIILVIGNSMRMKRMNKYNAVFILLWNWTLISEIQYKYEYQSCENQP